MQPKLIKNVLHLEKKDDMAPKFERVVWLLDEPVVQESRRYRENKHDDRQLSEEAYRRYKKEVFEVFGIGRVGDANA